MRQGGSQNVAYNVVLTDAFLLYGSFDVIGPLCFADHPTFTSTHEELEDVEPSTRYLFQIVAHDESGGSVTSNVITKTTKPWRNGQETP